MHSIFNFCLNSSIHSTIHSYEANVLSIYHVMRFSFQITIIFNRISSAEMNIHINDSTPCSDVYIWQDEKKIEYQASLRNEQTCIAFEEMLCAAAEGCSSDNLCDIFNGMLENALSPLFLKKQHQSKCRKNIKNNFPSNPWYDKECKSLRHVLNNIAKDKKFNTRQSEYNIMLRQYKQLIQKKKRHYQEVNLVSLKI